MKIDLGCGDNKQPGFVGIDRYKTVDADIVCDINDKIPLEDNTVEYVIASHSLEHVTDLMKTMKELYRVCKDRAIVCIVSPYYYTSLNMANPFHKQVFNEHTPRFFTSSDYTLVPLEEYDFPHAHAWALGQSDNSTLDMDYRCIRMEFFYFPEYRRLPEEEKRKARVGKINVVDQIMYHLLVVKNPIANEEIDYISHNTWLQEPHYVTDRRLRERLEDDKYYYELEINKKVKEFELERLEHSRKVGELESEKLDYGRRVSELESENLDYIEKIERLNLENLGNSKKIEMLEFGLKDYKSRYNDSELKLEILEKKIKEGYKIIEQNKNELDIKSEICLTRDIENKNYKNRIDTLIKLSSSYKDSIRYLLMENDLLKNSKINKVINKLNKLSPKNKTDLGELFNDECQVLLEESILESSIDLNKYRVTLSPFLKENDIIFYYVIVKKDNWKSIEAIFTNLNIECGKKVIGMEILTLSNEILRTVFLNSEDIKHNGISSISFEPIIDSANKKYIVRFMGLADSFSCGVSVYQWEKSFGRKERTYLLGKLGF